jgi:hypothetical protein
VRRYLPFSSGIDSPRKRSTLDVVTWLEKRENASL